MNYVYSSRTDHVSNADYVAAILFLQYMVQTMLFHMTNIFYL